VDNWFPLSKSMMEGNADFRKLTPGEKVFWLSILSQINLRGEFYKADLEWAVVLALSLSKVRQARRKLQALGWLKVTPGRKAQGRRLATRYHLARWAKPEPHVLFAQMQRYAWEALLDHLQPKRRSPWAEKRLKPWFNHCDLVVYAFLCYFWQRFLGPANGDIFITKGQLQKATNLPNAAESVRRLYADYTFYRGAHLFKVREGHHRFQITEWAWFADPHDDDHNAKIMAERERRLRETIARVKTRQLLLELGQSKGKAGKPVSVTAQVSRCRCHQSRSSTLEFMRPTGKSKDKSNKT